MKARTIQYQPDGSIEFLDVSVDDPAPHEVQLKALACGICSWDIATCKLGLKMKVPAPAGHEGVGIVTKVGPEVSGFEEGDRVAAGGFQTYNNVSVRNLQKIPVSDIPVEQWLVEPVSCAITGLDHCRLKTGDRVVVIGCGFMGLLILQGLARSNAAQVIGIDIDQKRLDLAASFGIKETFNVSSVDSDALAKELAGRHIDVVVDTSGSQQGLDMATAIVRSGGILNLFGWIKGETAAFDPSDWHLKGITVINSSPSSQLRATFEPAIRMIREGLFDLKPVVSHVVSLDDYPQLMRDIVGGVPGYVKGVVKLA
ncbi:MAG: zinc-binding dehydrogenase [Verrucomicrobia bacterium]|nr:zinc-binding dehydrogenase [Verrucomicrobiota bacterium]MDA1088424.1 zinc-binding dehydrogenase [Verrucomicrobiota bacterium]